MTQATRHSLQICLLELKLRSKLSNSRPTKAEYSRIKNYKNPEKLFWERWEAV